MLHVLLKPMNVMHLVNWGIPRSRSAVGSVLDRNPRRVFCLLRPAARDVLNVIESIHVPSQARGVIYPNLTDAFAANSTAVDQQVACACTSDGNSGSTFLGSNLAGCKQHGLSLGDNEYYCYVKGGSNCLAATPSTSYPGKQQGQDIKCSTPHYAVVYIPSRWQSGPVCEPPITRPCTAVEIKLTCNLKLKTPCICTLTST